MTFEMLLDQETYPYPDSDMCEAWYFMDGLKTEMTKLQKEGKKWKGTRPTVKMARLQPVLHILSPYTYERKASCTDNYCIFGILVWDLERMSPAISQYLALSIIYFYCSIENGSLQH